MGVVASVIAMGDGAGPTLCLVHDTPLGAWK